VRLLQCAPCAGHVPDLETDGEERGGPDDRGPENPLEHRPARGEPGRKSEQRQAPEKLAGKLQSHAASSAADQIDKVDPRDAFFRQPVAAPFGHLQLDAHTFFSSRVRSAFFARFSRTFALFSLMPRTSAISPGDRS